MWITMNHLIKNLINHLINPLQIHKKNCQMHPASHLLMAQAKMFQTKHGSIAEMINKRILASGHGGTPRQQNRLVVETSVRGKQSVKCTHMETMLVAAMTFGRLTSCVQPTVTLSAYQPPAANTLNRATFERLRDFMLVQILHTTNDLAANK